MSEDHPGLTKAQARMREAGVSQTAVAVFTRSWHRLREGDRGTLAEADLEPVTSLDALADLDPGVDPGALARTAVVKLNGGLGTSMGMSRAKSLLPVREGHTFLDLIVAQVRSARRASGSRLPLVLMNSFSTQQDCLAALEAYPDLAVEGVSPDFLQSMEPKLRADDLGPVTWPADPALEWCPPGHGDLYVALWTSGILSELLEAGFGYAFVSNADNLGAAPSAALAHWFAASGAPFAMEVCRRTTADRKGGHLAVRAGDGRLVLREKAQVAEEDVQAFGDIDRHRYFNTNSVWLDLRQVRDVLAQREGVLGLPMMVNAKTVDPTDAGSTPVLQIESAMGAAIEVFQGATAIEVPRSRFRPVKTTDDLVLLRSDAFELAGDGTLDPVVEPLPLVTLGPAYTTIRGFDQRFAHGPPSLRDADALTLDGDWTFGRGVQVRGEVRLADTGRPEHVPDGAVLD